MDSRDLVNLVARFRELVKSRVLASGSPRKLPVRKLRQKLHHDRHAACSSFWNKPGPHHPEERSTMPTLVTAPSIVQAVGNKPKHIQEFVGRANTADDRLSIARMQSPSGWKEPGQRPEFLEITIVLRGMLRVEHSSGVIDVHAGQAIIAEPGEWIRYSTPDPEGAETISVCLPAFSADTVHRDAPCG